MSMIGRIVNAIRTAGRTILEVLYGMTIYDWVRELAKARSSKERIFTLIVFGDLLGIPTLPPYYSLRLLPYMVPTLKTWRRSMLRERDLTDLADRDIG
jgi:hypothetical protein